MDSLLSDCVYDMGIEEVNRYERLVKTFLSRFERPDSDFNKEGKRLFVISDKVIDLYALEGKKFQNIEEMLSQKESWLLPIEARKDNLFTHFSSIRFPFPIDVNTISANINEVQGIVSRSMGGREDCVEAFFDIIAAALSGERKADYFLNLRGVGGSGKTTVLEFIQYIFGSYFTTMDTESLMQTKPSAYQKLYHNKNCRILNFPEPSSTKKKVELLKKITGNTPLEVSDKTFKISSLVVIDSNHPLLSEREDSGFERRQYILPYGPKISEEEQNRNLKEKLKELAPSFLLELLRRYSCLDLSKMKKPKITDTVRYWDILEEKEEFPKAFMDIMCTSDVENGKEMKLTDILKIYKTEFIDVYKDFRQKNLFWLDDFQKESVIINISAKKFDSIFCTRFRNCGISSGYKTIRHIVIGNSGDYGSMEKRQIEDLKKRFNIDEEEAKVRIEQARKSSTVSAMENPFEGDFRDLYSYKGLWGFETLGIPNADPKEWKIRVMNLLCMNFPNSLFVFKTFCDSVMALKDAEKIYSTLYTKISKYLQNQKDCLNNVEVQDVLDEVFKSFTKWIRDDLKKKVKFL